MRKNILSLHLLLATFMTPVFIMVAISGGLYLVGIKGSTKNTNIEVGREHLIDLSSLQLEKDVRKLIVTLGLNIDFEYLKLRGSTIITRPTSREFLKLEVTGTGLKLQRKKPDLQSSLIELHKGHGPTLFKAYQKLVAVSLIFVMLSGLWMGLTNRVLRRKTILALGFGSLTFLLLALS